jgi:hypothetical protein
MVLSFAAAVYSMDTQRLFLKSGMDQAWEYMVPLEQGKAL